MAQSPTTLDPWGTMGAHQHSYDAEAGYSDNGIPDVIDIGGQRMKRLGDSFQDFGRQGAPLMYHPEYGWITPEAIEQAINKRNVEASSAWGPLEYGVLSLFAIGGGLAASGYGATAAAGAEAGVAGTGATATLADGTAVSLGNAAGVGGSVVELGTSGAIPQLAAGGAGVAAGAAATGGEAGVEIGTANQFAGGAAADVSGTALSPASGAGLTTPSLKAASQYLSAGQTLLSLGKSLLSSAPPSPAAAPATPAGQTGTQSSVTPALLEARRRNTLLLGGAMANSTDLTKGQAGTGLLGRNTLLGS